MKTIKVLLCFFLLITIFSCNKEDSVFEEKESLKKEVEITSGINKSKDYKSILDDINKNFKYKVIVNENAHYFTNEKPEKGIVYELNQLNEKRKNLIFSDSDSDSDYGTLSYFIKVPEISNPRRIKELIGRLKFLKNRASYINARMKCLGEDLSNGGVKFSFRLSDFSDDIRIVRYGTPIYYTIRLKKEEIRHFRQRNPVLVNLVGRHNRIGKYINIYADLGDKICQIDSTSPCI